MISVEFLLTSLIVILIPGTGVIFTVSTGITQGRKASVYAALGCEGLRGCVSKFQKVTKLPMFQHLLGPGLSRAKKSPDDFESFF